MQLSEDAAGQSSQPTPTDGAAQIPTPAATEAPPAPEQPEAEPLAPESEVLLVRLLAKALVMNIKPDDAEILENIGTINENNAKTALTKIINLMKTYSSDIDVNTNSDT